MPKVKYHFNTQTLKYERVVVGIRHRLLTIGFYLLTAIVFSFFTILVYPYFFDSPQEKELKRKLENTNIELQVLKQRSRQMQMVLHDLQERDNTIYRVIFESEPIPSSVREGGFGGADRYSWLSSLYSAETFTELTQQMDKLSKQLYVQSKSYDELWQLVKNKATMLASIPAIQPISNKDLTRLASGFGMRIHPIYKTAKMHEGMDFTAPIGTDIYATGDGTVESVEMEGRGYGNNVIINHGYGYQTLYAHLSKVKVARGAKVKRGDIIGLVGSTGSSTGPHLHYEVRKNTKAVNPINFYYNDLSPQEYEAMLEKSKQSSQSFD